MTPKSERCFYCGKPAHRTEPFGQQHCCEECFLILISDDDSGPAWKCGNADGTAAST